MKKLLIATAALAMVAGTAQAQSTVSVYGAVGGSNNAFQRNSIDTPAQFQDSAQDFLGTTALGFTGTEDLGGGNKAFFRLEGDLSMSGRLGGATASTTTSTALTYVGATVSATNVASSGTIATPTYTTSTTQATFNRHAHVGIESAKFGTISVGRQNDSIKDLEGLGQVYNLSDNLHMNTAVGDRYASVYKYATPTISGFKASYSYSNNATANTDVTADGATTLNSYALSYTYKNYSFGAGMGAVSEVSKDDLKTTFLGARATFGALTVGAHHAINEQGVKELKQTMVSANYAVNGNIDLKAHYVKNNASGANGVDVIGTQSTTANGQNDGDGYGLMAVYNFSKRTAAYAGYADFDATDKTVSSKITTIGLFHKF